MQSEGMDDEGSSSDSSDSISPGDYDRRREQNIRRQLWLERHFSWLKARLHDERHLQLERRWNELLTREAEDFRSRKTALEDECKSKLEMCARLREYQLEELTRVGRGRTDAIEMNLRNNRDLLRDEIENEIRNQICALQRDKLSADLSLSLWLEESTRERKAPPVRGKPRVTTVSEPFVVYNATPEDIDEDCRVLRRSVIEAELRRKLEIIPPLPPLSL